MVFWLSVIVFIAGIMTYMFFPRSDQYQLDIYKQEGNVVSFVNQHQVAKDLMQQRIMWRINDANNRGVYELPWQDMINSAPDLMQIGDVYHENGVSALNPATPSRTNGYYTSAVVCLAGCNNSDADCVNGKKMVSCPSGEQYVITYGYMPDWWNKDAYRKQAWFKSMLKRTRGGIGCGLLAHQGNGLYSLDNSQKYIGYQVINNQRVIPPALTGQLQTIGLTTCAPGVACDDPLQDLMFCMTPFTNPYQTTPIFWWDSLNNTGTGIDHRTAQWGTPLVGTLNGGDVDHWANINTYTIAGVVSIQASPENSNATQDLFQLNANTTLREECSAATCTLSVHDDNNGNLVSVGNLPNNREYAFIYTVSGGAQTLTVYYSVVNGGTLSFTSASDSQNSAGPALSAPAFAGSPLNYPHLRAVRIYNGGLTLRQINHDIKADKKRFGL